MKTYEPNEITKLILVALEEAAWECRGSEDSRMMNELRDKIIKNNLDVSLKSRDE